MLKYMRGAKVECKETINGRKIKTSRPLPIEARLKLAEACAPYLHHKLSAVDKLPSAQPEPAEDADDDHILPDFRRPW